MVQFDKSIHPVVLYEYYLICIFMNIHENLLIKFSLSMKDININIKSQNENVNEGTNNNNRIYKSHLMGLIK